MLLAVGSATPVGNVAHFENSTGSCYINPTTTSLSCSSDARLKTNVADIDASSTLAEVLALNPVTYNWLTEATGTPTHGGFIAQQVLPILPDLVSKGPDGYYTLNYAGFTPYLVKAIQELSAKLDALATAVANFAQSFTTQVLTAATGHFSNELCVGSTCVTPTQFQAMVAAAGQSQSASPSSSPTSLASDNPAAGSTAGSSSSSALSSATASTSPTVDAATSTSSWNSDATSSLPLLDSAPPLAPDYAATTSPSATVASSAAQ
jgi:hypothetical protein